MHVYGNIREMYEDLAGIAEVAGPRVRVLDAEGLRGRADRLAAAAAFGSAEVRSAAAWLLRAAAADLGAWAASIHPLYMARARGEWGGHVVPALNMRFGYPQIRAAMRAALDLEVGLVTFEIARSEMGYTETRPQEYASGVFAAAIREGWTGPLFIQGDHFQVDAKRFATEPEPELADIEALIDEAIAAGFYNIDLDSSTLVDLSRPTVDEQQRPNYEVAVRLAGRVRGSQPEGLVISIGGEIGEVGKQNSTVEELDAYVTGFERLAAERDLRPGLSKVSVQTGTSHGGIVLPDGSVAPVNIDFETLRELSHVARERYGMAGAVQHGASTLPSELFDRFPPLEVAEIHLATGYQNVTFESEHFPSDLRERMYAWVRQQFPGEPGREYTTDAQLLYKERKRAIGPFKRELWDVPDERWEGIRADLRSILTTHFTKLGVAGTRELVARHLPRLDVPIAPPFAA
ncbi:MAG TPA: class II fructose-bisphosphate aldolase [Dehalococcoidia bacterium]|nr:class II fructose-bisphosphate aldolase [Dehalococcoidia bacterium]